MPQLLMATSGEGSNPGGRAMPRPLAQVQELAPRVARRRLSQARHRATLTKLFSNLRKVVYQQSDFTASKWQVLNRAKSHIQEQEQILDNLLKVKESFKLEDGNANSLEEVKENYASMFCRNHRRPGQGPWSRASGLPDGVVFCSRYLNFYKQTMDLLTRNKIVSSQEATLPVVSAAISHLWQTLSEEKASLLQALAQKHSGLSGLEGATQQPACVEDSMKDSGVDSQGASFSLESTPPEELLFEDAFDVACFLDKSEAPSISSPSSMFASCNPENPEEKFQLYTQIVDFFKGLCCVNTQVKQEADLPMDDEMMMLQCMETFDDEDL
ncbi:PREDICTED: stimulated by retinoic acid gene 8 protein homolog [Miniopterus natalensis]|uniref:stimulated by retinoic acid gene 8 protein homolog n=1 Tax=Miniopterus natalensis TaxID=291302 RepID=UPI0007A6EAC0|nr:PREDICTED: stimulated by retinoic acid gene 8 protein homolog [Miniopterus natalensis]